MARFHGEGPESKPQDLTHKFDFSDTSTESPARPPSEDPDHKPNDLSKKFDFSDTPVVPQKPKKDSKTKPPMSTEAQGTRHVPKDAPGGETAAEHVEELGEDDLIDLNDAEKGKHAS